MAIAKSDLKWYLSNKMPLTIVGSAGGVIDTGELATALLNTIFPARAVREVGGSTLYFYAKIFLKNTHATQTLISCKIYLHSQEHAKQIKFALEGGDSPTLDGNDWIVNPETRPDGLIDANFSAWGSTLAKTVGSGGSLGPGIAQGLWLKQTIEPGLSADASVPYRPAWKGNTPA